MKILYLPIREQVGRDLSEALERESISTILIKDYWPIPKLSTVFGTRDLYRDYDYIITERGWYGIIPLIFRSHVIYYAKGTGNIQHNNVPLKLILHYSECIFYLSCWLKNTYEEWWPYLKGKQNYVIHHAPASEFISVPIPNNKKPHEPARLLHVTNCNNANKVHGLNLAMEVYRELKRRSINCEMTVITRGKLAPREIPDATYLKDVNSIQLIAMYDRSDILLYPSTSNALSRVALEGHARGLPIVTTGMDGISEFNSESIVTGTTAEDLAKLTIDILNHYPKRASNQFTWEASARNIKDALRQQQILIPAHKGDLT